MKPHNDEARKHSCYSFGVIGLQYVKEGHNTEVNLNSFLFESAQYTKARYAAHRLARKPSNATHLGAANQNARGPFSLHQISRF